MKVLVLTTDYLNPQNHAAYRFIHVRNIYYMKNGIDVTVLNFKAIENYVIEDIAVITLDEYIKNNRMYDILICHAPNIRNHYRFIKKHGKKFPKIAFFFHGHEVLRINKVYPKPYPFIKQASLLNRIGRGFYDIIKLKIWKSYFPKLTNKSHFIFVSKWMYNEFIQHTQMKESILNQKYTTIYNSIDEVFEKENYTLNSEKIYDFITMRGSLDGSKYSIDIVNELAKNNPYLKFLIIGKGVFFNHIKKADNIVWLNKTISPENMINYLNKSKSALMPTKCDAQGVMSCEIATFGLPVITSDIPVCHEIFEDFKNVELIDNNNVSLDLSPILKKLTENVPYEKNKKYFSENTVEKEVEILKQLTKT